MSLGPVKPIMHGVPTAISEAPKEHVAEDETFDQEDNQDHQEDQKSPDTPVAKEQKGVENILKTAIEAELPKVNILNERGEKVVPDISGMVINILT